MNFPNTVRYTSEHEWIRVEGDEAYVGITDYAQSELGEIVFVDVPMVGEVETSTTSTKQDEKRTQNHFIACFAFALWVFF